MIIGFTRTTFILIQLLLLVPAIIMISISPRYLFGLILIIAVTITPIISSKWFSNGEYIGQYMQLFIAAVAIAGLLVPFIIKRETLMIVLWKKANRISRFILISLMILIFIATIRTWLDLSPAAGTAVLILMWPLALSGVLLGNKKGYIERELSQKFFIKCSLGAGIVLLIAGSVYGYFGHLFIIMGVIGLSFLGLGLGSRIGPIGRTISFLIFVVFILGNFRFSPTTQSVSIGFLFGAIWVIIVWLWSKNKHGLPKKVILTIIIISILIFPLITISVYFGRNTGIGFAIINYALSITGESEENLFNRPARWEALFQDIMREPFRVKFTNYLDTEYFTAGKEWQAAYPHNILITTARNMGIPGLFFFFCALLILIGAGLNVVKNSIYSSWQANALTGWGVIISLLFRNMWSNSLFVEPTEIVFFSLAVFVILHYKANLKVQINEMEYSN